ncbi:hypothetical protein BN1723_008407, partial [Verticillium longisporum]
VKYSMRKVATEAWLSKSGKAGGEACTSIDIIHVRQPGLTTYHTRDQNRYIPPQCGPRRCLRRCTMDSPRSHLGSPGGPLNPITPDRANRESTFMASLRSDLRSSPVHDKRILPEFVLERDDLQVREVQVDATDAVEVIAALIP